MDTIPYEVLTDYQNRTVVSVSNLHWGNPDQTMLTADVVFQELEALGPIPFSTVDNADTRHGQEIWDKASAGDYGAIAPYVAPAPTAEDVIAERERRLALGFDFDFGDSRGVHRFGTTPQDMAGWREVTDLANAMLAANDTTTPIGIVTNTGPTQVTAPVWTLVLLAAAQFRQPIWAASFALQAMSPIPNDYTADHYWAP